MSKKYYYVVLSMDLQDRHYNESGIMNEEEFQRWKAKTFTRPNKRYEFEKAEHTKATAEFEAFSTKIKQLGLQDAHADKYPPELQNFPTYPYVVEPKSRIFNYPLGEDTVPEWLRKIETFGQLIEANIVRVQEITEKEAITLKKLRVPVHGYFELLSPANFDEENSAKIQY